MQSKDNYYSLDLLRSWAMIIMIEVHVFNAFLQPWIREADWFIILNFINGMVAPSFIFISGFAFVISSENRITEMRNYGNFFRKKIFRIGQIFFAGYLIHIPYYSFRNNIYYTDAALLNSFYNVDVLQCIGAGVLVLFTARMAIRSEKVYMWYIIVSAIGIVIFAPFVWHADFSRFLPLPFACYFNESHGSYFPIFPWLGFLFSGAGAALFIMRSRKLGQEDEFMIRMAVIGAFLFILSFPMLSWLKTFSWFEIKTCPVFFLQRLGVIIVLLYLLRLYIKIRGERESFFFDIGRESLLIYWLHLVIIYRILFNDRSIDKIINRSFGVGECMAATAVMILLMLAIAVIWGRIKKYYPDTGRKIFIFASVAGVVFFYFN